MTMTVTGLGRIFCLDASATVDWLEATDEFVHYQNRRHDVLKINELIAMQIGTSGPRIN